jgi:carboxyl-terminal processing protease
MTHHRRTVAVLLGALALANTARAQSPSDTLAQRLFVQAGEYLESLYYGPSTIDLKALVARYQAQLNTACAAQSAGCEYTVAEPIIAAMLAELGDPHTFALTPAELRADQAYSSGSSNSPALRVGIRFMYFCDTPTHACTYDRDGNPTTRWLPDALITAVVPDSPAARAGVRAGDRFIGYDGALYASATNNEEVLKLEDDFTARVRAGQTVTMSVLRGPERTRLEIPVRGEIINDVIPPTLEVRSDGIGVLTISSFADGVGQRVHNLIRDALERGARGLILNMRDNPGGYIDEMMLTAGALIENPPVIRYKTREDPRTTSADMNYERTLGAVVFRTLGGEETYRLGVKNQQVFAGALAVLVNNGCVSSCEAVSSLVQRAGRGPMIGEETFGVGNTIYEPFELMNGGSMRITTARALWTDGTPLPARVTPDIKTPDYAFVWFQTGVDAGMDAALKSVGGSSTAAVTARLEPQGLAGVPAFGGADALSAAFERIGARAARRVIAGW